MLPAASQWDWLALSQCPRMHPVVYIVDRRGAFPLFNLMAGEVSTTLSRIVRLLCLCLHVRQVLLRPHPVQLRILCVSAAARCGRLQQDISCCAEGEVAARHTRVGRSDTVA